MDPRYRETADGSIRRAQDLRDFQDDTPTLWIA
jgi:hypothetical protein